MKNDTRLIWVALLALLGGFMAWTSAEFLLNFDACAASAACTEHGPSSNSSAWLNLLFGVVLLNGAYALLRPGQPMSGLLLMIVAAACAAYIGSMILSWKGIMTPSWSSENAFVNFVIACLVLVVTLRALLKKR